MWRTWLGLLIIAHGLVTMIIWAPSPSPQAPMNTSRSWLLGDARTVSVVLTLSAGALITASGAGLLAHQDWWSLAGLLGGTLSLTLFVLFFTPWWLVAILISLALVGASLRDRIGA